MLAVPPLRLGVNVDHVATLRNARSGARPDPVRAALLAIEAGDGKAAGEHLDDVKQFVAEQKIPYRVLIDKKEDALAAYSGGDFPGAVWIDKTGVIRRRFVGLRNEQVLEQMLDWVNQTAAG